MAVIIPKDLSVGGMFCQSGCSLYSVCYGEKYRRKLFVTLLESKYALGHQHEKFVYQNTQPIGSHRILQLLVIMANSKDSADQNSNKMMVNLVKCYTLSL